jgi:hypothetical protein
MNSNKNTPRPAATGTGGNSKSTRNSNRPPARFQDETLEALRARLPDYLEACGVELRRSGNRLVGHCPNHEDRHPSFAVFADGQACGCYPCGFSGDIFKTAQWLGRAGTFPEAVRNVASVLGVPLAHEPACTRPRPAKATPRPAKRPPELPPMPDLPDGFEEASSDKRGALYQACTRRTLAAVAVARELGTDLETLRMSTFTSDGVGIEAGCILYLYESGVKRRYPRGHEPRFKWIYGSARLPWRWHFAARPEVKTVYVCEGESDALAALAAGLEVLHPPSGTEAAAVVACPGTAFLEAWGPLFKGKRAVLLFDNDKAGRDATERTVAILRPFAAEIRVANWEGETQP